MGSGYRFASTVRSESACLLAVAAYLLAGLAAVVAVGLATGDAEPALGWMVRGLPVAVALALVVWAAASLERVPAPGAE